MSHEVIDNPQFTPGPWHVFDDGKSEPAVWRAQLEGEPDYIVREVAVIGRYPGEVYNNFGDGLADARLIAQAPTMYTLLNQLRGAIKLGRLDDVEVADAFIHKINEALLDAA